MEMGIVNLHIKDRTLRTRVFKRQHLVEKRQSLLQNFTQLTKNSTLTLTQLREATYSTVDDITLLQNANLMIMLQIDSRVLPTLFRSTMKLGYALGLKTPKSIESLGKGLARKSPSDR